MFWNSSRKQHVLEIRALSHTSAIWVRCVCVCSCCIRLILCVWFSPWHYFFFSQALLTFRVRRVNRVLWGSVAAEGHQ